MATEIWEVFLPDAFRSGPHGLMPLVGVIKESSGRHGLMPLVGVIKESSGRHGLMPTRGITTSQPAPLPTPLSVSPGGDRGGWASRNVVTPLVGVRRTS